MFDVHRALAVRIPYELSAPGVNPNASSKSAGSTRRCPRRALASALIPIVAAAIMRMSTSGESFNLRA
jgi:hypothetical protein